MGATGSSVRNRLPGFALANLRKNLDGTRVANYAQRRSRKAFEAMLEDPATIGRMGEAAELAGSIELRF